MFFQGRCHVCWTPQSMKMWFFQESHDSFLKKRKETNPLGIVKKSLRALETK